MRSGLAMCAAALALGLVSGARGSEAKPYPRLQKAQNQPEAEPMERLRDAGIWLNIEDVGAWHHAAVGEDSSGGYLCARARRVETTDDTRVWVDIAAMQGRFRVEATPELLELAMRRSPVTSLTIQELRSLMEFVEALEELELRAPETVVRSRAVTATWQAGTGASIHARLAEGGLELLVSSGMFAPGAPEPELPCPAAAFREALEAAMQDARAMEDMEPLLASGVGVSVVVTGAFDFDGDTEWTVEEARSLASALTHRGVRVLDALSADTDCLIVGKRPRVPPPPPPGAEISVLAAWQQLDRAARRYDELLQTAQTLGVRVLRENEVYGRFDLQP